MPVRYAVTKPSWFSSGLELRENDRIVGALKMRKAWSYALAEATVGGRTVRFGYGGWNMYDVFVRDASDREIGAVRRLSWWKYDMSLVLDGKEYLWKQTNWWSMRFAWFADGKEIMAFRSRWGVKHFADIECASKPDDTEMILLHCGLYLLKLHEMNAASGVV